jgi:hypothetical protein
VEHWDFDNAPKLHLDMGSHRAACDGSLLDTNREASDPECRDMRPCQMCQLLQSHFFREGVLV